MTATLPQRGPSAPGGPPRVRVDARPGYVYGYRIRDHHTGLVRIDYVGQTRNLDRRDGQHRGLLPQRDGFIREQPWADLIDDSDGHQPVVLERGIWSDTDLDVAELRHMHTLLPRMNYRDSITPDAIPIPAQQRQRDARDAAKGLPPRDWSRPAVSTSVRPRPQPASFVPPRHVQPLGRSNTRWARLWASPAGRWLTYRLRRAGTVAGWWVVLTLAGTAGLWWAAPHLHVTVSLRDCAGASAVLAAAALWRWWPRRRGRSRHHKPRRNRRR